MTAKYRLYMGDIGKHEVECEGVVTCSAGYINATITSVKWSRFGCPTLELKSLLERSAVADIEQALREKYQEIQDKYKGQPDDFQRDHMEGA